MAAPMEIDDLYCTESSAITDTPLPNSFTLNKDIKSKAKKFASTPYAPGPPQSNGFNPDKGSVASAKDRITEDVRVVQNMIRVQNIHSRPIFKDYLASLPANDTSVTPGMRKILLSWMYEVVTDQKINETVFLQAADYVDRFLTATKIEKTKLQLLGCCCLLIASKVRNFITLSAANLAYLTDGAYTEKQITQYEMVVLSKLGWDMTSILGSDFVESILTQANLKHLPFVQTNSIAFLSLLTIYGISMDHTPAFLAASCVHTGLTYNKPRVPTEDEQRLVLYLKSVFTVKKEDLMRMRDLISEVVDKELGVPSRRSRRHPEPPYQQMQDMGLMQQVAGSDTESDSGVSSVSCDEEDNLISSFEELNNMHEDIEDSPYHGVEDDSILDYQNMYDSVFDVHLNESLIARYGPIVDIAPPSDSDNESLSPNILNDHDYSHNSVDPTQNQSLNDLSPSNIKDIRLSE